MPEVIVVIGAGLIGQAIARRVGVGSHVMLADRSEPNANAAAEVLGNAGYDVSVATVDVSLRTTVHALVEKAVAIGEITGLIHTAGDPPARRRRRRSCASISTAPVSCSRSLAP